MQFTPAEKLINHKSKKCKGRTISTLDLRKKVAKLSKEFIDCVVEKLISKRIIPADNFPCGSTGKATTIDLITSLLLLIGRKAIRVSLGL
jgi:FAD synthase